MSNNLTLGNLCANTTAWNAYHVPELKCNIKIWPKAVLRAPIFLKGQQKWAACNLGTNRLSQLAQVCWQVSSYPKESQEY